MKTKIIIALVLLLSSCGGSTNSLGGAEAGNPSNRTIQGQLATTNTSNLVSYQTSDSCPADTIIATDSTGQTTTASIATSCAFTLNLTINKSYSISFVLDDVFVATMIFNNSISTVTSTVFTISSGDTNINLGSVTFTNSIATAENEASQQNDQDGDGTNDFDDDDDDNDGILDTSESDCDLDGHSDDLDDDDTCDDSSGSAPTESTVLEVHPKNDEINASFDDDIEVRVGCSLATSSVTNTSFTITSDDSTNPTCNFNFSSSDAQIRCEPTFELSASTIYTITLRGLQCEGGDVIPTTNWSFTTE